MFETLRPTYELIAYEIVIQHHKADHDELRQVDLELEALVEDGVVAIVRHRPGAALRAVGGDTVDLYVHVGVHDVSFGP